MIKVDKSEVSIEVSDGVTMLVTEATVMLRAVRNVIIERDGEEMANKMLDDAYRLSKMSGTEIDKEARKCIVKAMMSILFGGGY